MSAKWITTGVLVALFFGAWSCSEPFEFRTSDEHERVVIFCVLSDTVKHQRIDIRRTAPFSGGITTPVRGADVRITDSKGAVYTATQKANLVYETDLEMVAQHGMSYTLEVRCDSNDDGVEEYYHATTTVLPPVHLERLRVTPLRLGVGDFTPYKVSIDGEDPEGPNAYIHRLAVNGEMRGEFNQWIYGDDALFDGERYEDYPLVMLTNDPDEEEWIKVGDTVGLFTSVVESDFAAFVGEVFGSEGGEMPLFGGPPYNVRTNFEGGALGWFGNLVCTSIEAKVE